jgi:hypothetical protein
LLIRAISGAPVTGRTEVSQAISVPNLYNAIRSMRMLLPPQSRLTTFSTVFRAFILELLINLIQYDLIKFECQTKNQHGVDAERGLELSHEKAEQQRFVFPLRAIFGRLHYPDGTEKRHALLTRF